MSDHLELVLTMLPHPTVHLGADAPSIGDVVAVADGARVQLDDMAIRRIQDARAVVDRLASGETLIYGLNTGLGHLRNQRVSTDALQAYEIAVVRAHDGAIGPPLPARVVRAAMFVRLAGLTRGGAGASLDVARQLEAMLSAGVHPIVPTVGSVGASDLMHMAAIGAVMLGGGLAELDGEVLPGGEALRRAGMAAVALEPKDGLALISANGVSVGAGALLASRAERVALAADLVLAVSLEAIRGNPSILDPAAMAAKPVPGQAASAAAVRGLLAGSDRWNSGGTASVQDPLSFRVGPQVHGAFREFTGLLRRQVEVELAASDDNPLVVPAEGRMISNGNFHPIALALAADALRPAAAHVGQLSDRRMNHLWGNLFDDTDLLTPTGMEALASRDGPLLRYAAATQAADLRFLAGPVTLDIGPLDLGVEDHATNAPAAVLRTGEALDRLEDVLAVELVMAADAVRHRAASVGRLGTGTAAAIDALRSALDAAGQGRDARTAHAAARAALTSSILDASGAVA